MLSCYFLSSSSNLRTCVHFSRFNAPPSNTIPDPLDEEGELTDPRLIDEQTRLIDEETGLIDEETGLIDQARTTIRRPDDIEEEAKEEALVLGASPEVAAEYGREVVYKYRQDLRNNNQQYARGLEALAGRMGGYETEGLQNYYANHPYANQPELVPMRPESMTDVGLRLFRGLFSGLLSGIYWILGLFRYEFH